MLNTSVTLAGAQYHPTPRLPVLANDEMSTEKYLRVWGMIIS